MDLNALGWAMAGLLFAGVIKGGTGLGYSTCAMPFLVSAVGLRAAMVVVLAPAIATNVSVALAAGHVRETWHRFFPFYLATLPGIGCGVLVLTLCDQTLATKALGIALVGYAVFAYARPKLLLPERLAEKLQGPAGFANGVVTGLTGSQVMPLLPYMMALDMEPSRLVQAVNLSVLVSSLVLAGVLLASGAVDAVWLAISFAAIMPALVGVKIGTLCRHVVSPERFRTLILLVLLAMGGVLATR